MHVIAEAHVRGIGMDAVGHAHFVTGQQRRCDMAGKGKIAERRRARKGGGDDLRPRNYLMSTSADMRAKSDATLRRFSRYFFSCAARNALSD